MRKIKIALALLTIIGLTCFGETTNTFIIQKTIKPFSSGQPITSLKWKNNGEIVVSTSLGGLFVGNNIIENERTFNTERINSLAIWNDVVIAAGENGSTYPYTNGFVRMYPGNKIITDSVAYGMALNGDYLAVSLQKGGVDIYVLPSLTKIKFISSVGPYSRALFWENGYVLFSGLQYGKFYREDGYPRYTSLNTCPTWVTSRLYGGGLYGQNDADLITLDGIFIGRTVSPSYAADTDINGNIIIGDSSGYWFSFDNGYHSIVNGLQVSHLNNGFGALSFKDSNTLAAGYFDGTVDIVTNPVLGVTNVVYGNTTTNSSRGKNKRK